MSIFGNLFGVDSRSLAKEIVREQNRIKQEEEHRYQMQKTAYEIQKQNPGSIGAKYDPIVGWKPIYKEKK